MYNQNVIIGRLTKDIELRYTPGGTAVANMTIACDVARTKKDEKWENKTTFFDVVLWGKAAEAFSKIAIKGEIVYTAGHLESRSWEVDGQKRYKMEHIADFVRKGNGKFTAEGETYHSEGPPPDSDSGNEPF